MALSTKRKQSNNKDIYSTIDNSDMSQTQVPQKISVEDAKKILRQARLADHKTNIAEAVRIGNDEKLATACSGFLALYRNSQAKKTPTEKNSQKGKNEKH